MSLNLNENIQALVKDAKYSPLTESQSLLMNQLLTNTVKAARGELLSESTISADIAQFTPILMPIVRRVFPALVANQLLGVQPLTMPTGYIYALTNRYLGKASAAISPNTKSQILMVRSRAGTHEVNTATKITLKGGNQATGNVKYIEPGKITAVLVELENPSKKFSPGEVTVTGVNNNLQDVEITEVFSNEAAFSKILKNYAGPYTTTSGEKLGADMHEVGLSIEKATVEAQTRKLKAQYTLEMYEDLKNQHGILADEQLSSLIAAELQAEIDRDIIDFVNKKATPVADPKIMGAVGNLGRWEIEKYRVAAVKIDLEARNIGLATKRGSGNILVVSPKVATMLSQVGSFSGAKVDNTNITADLFNGNAGVYDGRFTVIVDQFATSDYITVVYKGAGNNDAMGFFSPYVPLSFQSLVDAQSGQPAMIGRTRYALTATPLSPESYARNFSLDFSNTMLA